MEFTCEVRDGRMHCSITVDEALRDPVFVCTGMQPMACVAGGDTRATLGSLIEVALPDLAPGVPHDIVLRYDAVKYQPVNRAWLPLGAYLRHAGGVTVLPPFGVSIRDCVRIGASLAQPSGIQ